ncbi:hypothetical protein A2771_04385 [Candidatus Woesebacteria bacterium RIFCSPHIGHO2_01_FULL_38_26b]|uniref:Arsenite methyltransferase n=1 Tax=Candidatus Woesebacteria bacterium RIFCSPHIGHO2_01_FULL_38_26b TaxID=1802491 RepID=A0A1F7Y213_9BACT|nr:MAG: hypothetical protein A2771_04385 [Candidatus Woesebacteria bacterium RIFCSPHIGHO2_01_FULL_38_26b]
MNNKTWDKFYKNVPLDEIPWQNTQADWFKELVDTRQIKGKTALDLGCGTGMKSIYLAKKGGFNKVVGVDISPTAINYARKNAEKKDLQDKVKFVAGNVTDLTFLRNRKFDFVLDWAVLHGIDKNERDKYIREIAKHTKEAGKLLLRVFAKPQGYKRSYFWDNISGKVKIYIFDERTIKNLFTEYFSIIKENVSKPKTKNELIFREYLMVRK